MEITERSVEKLTQINDGYIDLLAKFPHTKQAKLADVDWKRVVRQIKFIQENKDAFSDEKKKPLKPNFPDDKRRIPLNPLLR